MDKDKLNAILSIVVSAAIALLAVFGYNIIVVQPALNTLEAQVETVAAEPVVAERGLGIDRFYESMYIDKELTNAGTLTQTGPVLGASPLSFEGATADAYETTFTVVDPTADRTVTFPNSSGTVALNPAAGTWEFEGATADAFETTLTVTDPTADRTVTIGDDTGSVMLTSTPGVFVFGTNVITGTATISHGLTTPQTVFCTLLQDSEANAASCSATISGGTVTIKTWKADGATAASVGKIISWQVAGQQ